VHLDGAEVERVLASAEGAGAYRVEAGEQGVAEEPIAVQLLEPMA
jgi:hypothetical protein